MGTRSRLKRERKQSEEPGGGPAARATKPGRRLPNLLIAAGLVLLVGGMLLFFWKRPSGEALSLGGLLAKVSHVHALAIGAPAPGRPPRLILGTHDGMFVSEDEGKSWKPAAGPMGREDVMGFAGSPDGASFYAGGHNIAVMISKDAGSTWAPARGNLPGTDVHNLATFAGDGRIAYAFVVGHGLFRTENGGQTWTLMNRMEEVPIWALVVSRGSPDALYATHREGTFASRDGGRTWQGHRNELAGRRPFHLIEAAGSPGTLLVGSADGLYRSEDGGKSFRRESPGVVRGAILALAQHASGVAYAIAHDGSLFRSPKGGRDWVRVR